MNTINATRVEITSPELHKHIKQFQTRNPGMNDLAVLLEMAIGERWPGAHVDDVLRQAEINWLAMDRRKLVRDTARNMQDWVDTGIQGDMFNDMPISVPKWMLKDGEPVEYWKCTLLEAREYMMALAKSNEVQAVELERAAAVKRAAVDQLKQHISNIEAAISRARENGIDPATLRYAKAG